MLNKHPVLQRHIMDLYIYIVQWDVVEGFCSFLRMIEQNSRCAMASRCNSCSTQKTREFNTVGFLENTGPNSKHWVVQGVDWKENSDFSKRYHAMDLQIWALQSLEFPLVADASLMSALFSPRRAANSRSQIGQLWFGEETRAASVPHIRQASKFKRIRASRLFLIAFKLRLSNHLWILETLLKTHQRPFTKGLQLHFLSGYHWQCFKNLGNASHRNFQQ